MTTSRSTCSDRQVTSISPTLCSPSGGKGSKAHSAACTAGSLQDELAPVSISTAGISSLQCSSATPFASKNTLFLSCMMPFINSPVERKLVKLLNYSCSCFILQNVMLPPKKTPPQNTNKKKQQKKKPRVAEDLLYLL